LRLVAYRCRARGPWRGERLHLVGREAVDRLALAAAMRALLEALGLGPGGMSARGPSASSPKIC